MLFQTTGIPESCFSFFFRQLGSDASWLGCKSFRDSLLYYIQPLCSPTRATLLTGRWPLHHGIHKPFSPAQGGGLSLQEVTMA